ncbi:hypothetical protein FJ366_01620 [Candidatus Dependentiae bacterium]|nr:hypothetical protein [Candidatus Dependentiae bacterium]
MNKYILIFFVFLSPVFGSDIVHENDVSEEAVVSTHAAQGPSTYLRKTLANGLEFYGAYQLSGEICLVGVEQGAGIPNRESFGEENTVLTVDLSSEQDLQAINTYFYWFSKPSIATEISVNIATAKSDGLDRLKKLILQAWQEKKSTTFFIKTELQLIKVFLVIEQHENKFLSARLVMESENPECNEEIKFVLLSILFNLGQKSSLGIVGITNLFICFAGIMMTIAGSEEIYKRYSTQERNAWGNYARLFAFLGLSIFVTQRFGRLLWKDFSTVLTKKNAEIALFNNYSLADFKK